MSLLLSARRRPAMKGQSMVFERVLLFMIGVVIFVSCFAVFIGYQSYFSTLSTEDQLNSVGSYLSSAVLAVATNANNTEAELRVSVPPRIGGEQYYMELGDDGLEITTTVTEKKRTFSLYGLGNRFELAGDRILSSTGEFMIYKKGNRIIMV